MDTVADALAPKLPLKSGLKGGRVHNTESRPLHLHTLDSLIADLVSGRPVRSIKRGEFVLTGERARSALDWYRKKGAAAWTASVSVQNAEDLVAATLRAPPELTAVPARPANANNRRLRLKRLEAHRFAGLHKFGTPGAAPDNYFHEFVRPLTLFEGRNGSGKTSLLNAIIWALTGEMLRPQREPEPAKDFECWVASPEGNGERTTHKLSPLTPMPNVEQYRPDEPWVIADTWVELTFIDETGTELPTIRRGLSRSHQGKLVEAEPDLSVLAIDPIAARIGSLVPGLLSLIRVGSESELGRAVAQLTGLSALADLADHARRARTKIDKEFVKNKTVDRDRADRDYNIAKDDLERIAAATESIAPVTPIPRPSDDKSIENSLADITLGFEKMKTSAFESARNILGERFDPADLNLLRDLEKNIDRALERVSQPQELPSVARLSLLRKLTPEQLEAAETKICAILSEANALNALAQNPSTAARIRLYARVVTWMVDHPDPGRSENDCIVCGGNLESSVDSITGRPVKTHIHEVSTDAGLLSQTLGRWAENVQGDLLRSMPEPLRAEMSADLPPHPCDLLRIAIIDELFVFEPFRGVLAELKAQTAVAFDEVAEKRTRPADPTEITLPHGCEQLSLTLSRLDKAIRFARWRQDNEMLARDVFTRAFGRPPKHGEPSEKTTLTGKLLDLQATVKAAKPVSDALVQCERMAQHLRSRRAAESRLSEYATASEALSFIVELGQLADEQVDELRKTLRQDAADWRTRIYLGAFPDTAHRLIDTGMGRKGELDLVVEAGGVSAPAQHVTNASALRASLVAFFFAFWQYVLRERGGLTTLILDDPQELLDDENRERLAAALAHLVEGGAQLIVTSYDSRFCSRASRLTIVGGVEHFELHPATRQQPVIRTTLPIPVIQQRKAKFLANPNVEEAARDFADGCRVFFEAKLGDMFDDPAHSAWSIANPDPTLSTFVQRLRPLSKANAHGMFGAHVFRRFVDHVALADKSPVIVIMNKAHHGRRQEIRAADVAQCADHLSELLQLVEQMYEECYRWRRRDAPKEVPAAATPPALVRKDHPALNVMIYPDLAAFTKAVLPGESQETVERLDPHLLDSTLIYYLRRPNFGFAAPAGSLSIVEQVPGPGVDRSLVIARHGNATYARRLVRNTAVGIVGLTADVPDPRARTPTTIIVPDTEVAIHLVVGIIFDHLVTVEPGQDEAVLVDASDVLGRIQIAFRVADDSAVPLALDKQVVLGGPRIDLVEIGRYKDALVALNLDDGSSIFKRVGSALASDLAHLRQFESIGGLGHSEVISVGKPHKGFRHILDGRVILGVLYQG